MTPIADKQIALFNLKFKFLLSLFNYFTYLHKECILDIVVNLLTKLNWLLFIA